MDSQTVTEQPRACNPHISSAAAPASATASAAVGATASHDAAAAARCRRAIAIYRAFAGRIRRVAEDTYLVPSQTGLGLYLVYTADGRHHCQCPDHKKNKASHTQNGRNGFFCKHYYAAKLFRANSAICAGCGCELLTSRLVRLPYSHPGSGAIHPATADLVCEDCTRRHATSQNPGELVMAS